MTDQISVLVVDDHVLLAETLVAALQARSLRAELADLASREGLVERVRLDPPDLVMLDLALGGAIGDGATLVRPFVAAGARVLLVSATSDPHRVAAALEQGAVGHVPKSAPFLHLLELALAAAAGNPVMTPEVRRQMLHELHVARARDAETRRPFDRLTEREQQVLRAIGNGHQVSRIAADWCVSESTVRTQVRAVLCKLGVRSQIEAVGLAMRVGWLTPQDDLLRAPSMIPSQR